MSLLNCCRKIHRVNRSLLRYPSINRSLSQSTREHHQPPTHQESQSSHNSQNESRPHPQTSSSSSSSGFFNSTGFETAMGASVGVLLLGFAAMAYQEFYKSRVLSKMEAAFDPGYDPVLNLNKSADAIAHVKVTPPREEEELIESIVRGKEEGRYFLVLGSKGSGKSSLIIQKIEEVNADGCAFFEAHGDLGIVVDRFSESINYSMNRDYLGALVGLNDLSGMTSFQALERGLHKLERALIKRREKTGKPVVLVMNNCHLLPKDDEGVKLLRLFQQRAERWAAAGTCTFLLTTSDYWVFDVLRKASSRMDVLTFSDLTRSQSFSVLKGCRQKYYNEEPTSIDEGLLDEIYRIVGGRIGLLNRVARRKDMRKAGKQLIEDDVNWLLSKTGIIEDHDDDVMDEQKWSTCSWLLFSELAKRQARMEEEMMGKYPHQLIKDDDTLVPTYSVLKDLSTLRRMKASSLSDDVDEEEESEAEKLKREEEEREREQGHPKPESSITDPTHKHLEGKIDVPNPSLTWGEARQVMTRPDFISELDHLNIIHIDRHHRIRPDSMPLLRAFRRVSEEPGYAEKLESVMDRVSAIESLNRTRELVWKEQGDKGKFLVKKDGKGREVEGWWLLGGDERLGREEGEGAEE